jgi:hypothetical protein
VSIFAGIEGAERELVVEDLIGRGRSWHHGSPSQIKRFRECQSAWFLESVHGFPRKSTAATAAGTAMHAELETYLRDGTPPGPLASVGLAYLPTPPVPAELVEVPLAIRAAGLAPIVARIDLVDPDRFATVIDHKSTSSISKYAKTEDELRSDPQAIIYAVATAPIFAHLAGRRAPTPTPDYTTPARPGREVETYPGVALELDALDWLADGVRFEHVYYQSKPLRSARTSLILSKTDIVDGWAGVEADLRRMMAAAADAPHVSEVPHSLEACGNYGGCQFRKLCAGLGRRTMGVASAFFTDPGFAGTPTPVTKGSDSMGLLESLAKSRAAQTASAAPLTPSTPAADPFAVGAAALQKMRGDAPPSTPAPAADDDDEAELERQLAERRAAKAAAKAKAEADALAAAEAERLAAEKAEAERLAAEKAEAERLERERRATQAPETAAELDDEDAALERAIAERRAAKAAAKAAESSASTGPTINPPDGLPDGAPLPEAELVSKDSDPVVPKIAAVPPAYAGVRLRSIKKEGMIELFAALRLATTAAGMAPPGDVLHLWKAPADGLTEAKRTALKYGVEVALAMLQGKAIPSRDADDGDAPAASTAPTAPTAPSAEPSPKSPTPSEVLETPAPSAAPSRVLYVGCVPRRAPVVYLAELLAPMIAAAEAELAVQHYRIPQYKRGNDAVVARLAHALRSGAIVPPPALVVEVGLPLSADALAELLPFYDLIVERIG